MRLNKTQLNDVTIPLSKNSKNEFNYKEMLEFIFGIREAN